MGTRAPPAHLQPGVQLKWCCSAGERACSALTCSQYTCEYSQWLRSAGLLEQSSTNSYNSAMPSPVYMVCEEQLLVRSTRSTSLARDVGLSCVAVTARVSHVGARPDRSLSCSVVFYG